MSVFSVIKEAFGVVKTIVKVNQEFKAMRKKARSVTISEAAALSDEELTMCVSCRLEDVEYERLSALPEPVRFICTVNAYQAEVNNGGLCQYFVNSSRDTAPYLEKALSAVGAVRHWEQFHDFMESNRIDVNDLSDFILEDVEEFEEKCELYAFDDFDNAFYELEAEESLEALSAAYIRNHLSDFFTK